MASGTSKPRVVEDVVEEATAEAPASIYDEITVETKAGTFRFREVDGATYDKSVELATTKHEDGRETTNMVQLLRWLTEKSSVDKNFDMDALQALPFKQREKVLGEVNLLYFPDNAEELARQLRMRGYKVEAPPKDDSGND